MNPTRRTAVVVGALFLTADAAGVLSMWLNQTVVGASDRLAAVSVNVNLVATSALLELMMGLAVAGIAIAIYPVLRRFGERLALGYVVIRTVELMLAIIGTLGWLTLLTVGKDYVGAGSGDASLRAVGGMVLAEGDWANNAVLPIVFGLGALILNYTLYRFRLVPRWLSAWGFGAAALWLAAGVIETYGGSVVALAAPIGAQEIALALWLIVKGFSAAAFAPELGLKQAAGRAAAA